MQFNLSNLYPIDGPAFLLTLECPWVLNNGQITIHVREHFPHSINKTLTLSDIKNVIEFANPAL